MLYRIQYLLPHVEYPVGLKTWHRLVRIPTRVADHTRLTNPVIVGVMDVSMHPQCRLMAQNEVVETGSIRAADEIAFPMLGQRKQRRRMMRHHD